MNDKYIQYDVNYISGIMSLREPQKKSLEILDDIMTNLDIRNDSKEKVLQYVNNKYPICTDFERNFISLTFALATGVGKTRLMGTFITYLYTNHNIKNFLIVAPNTTIYEKLKTDLGGVGTNQLKKSILDSLKDSEKQNFLIVDCSDIKDTQSDFYVNCTEEKTNE